MAGEKLNSQPTQEMLERQVRLLSSIGKDAIDLGEDDVRQLLGSISEEELEQQLAKYYGLTPREGNFYVAKGLLFTGQAPEEAYRTIVGDEPVDQAMGIKAETPEEQPEQSGDETPEEEKADEGEKQLTDEEINQLMSQVLAQKDRYNNTISEDSVNRLLELAKTDPEKFKSEIQLQVAVQTTLAENATYLRTQREIAEILDGRSLEETVKVLDHDIEILSKDIKREKEALVLGGDNALNAWRTEDAKRYQQRRIADAEATLQEMQRKRALVANLQRGDEAVPVGMNEKMEPLPGEEEETRESDLEIYDVNDPMYETKKKTRRGRIEAALPFMKKERAEELMRDLLEVEALEQQTIERGRTAGFASAEGGEPTSDDVEGENGSNQGQPDKKQNRVNSGGDGNGGTGGNNGGGNPQPQPRPRTDEQAKQEYRQGLSDLADERGGIEDVKIPERKGVIKRLLGNVGKKKSFQRFKAKAFLKLLPLIGLGAVSSLNTYAADPGVMSTATAGTTDGEGGDIFTGATQNDAGEVNKITADLGMTKEDLQGGELDLAQYDLLAEGAKLYEGFMEREGSFQTPSGMMMNEMKYKNEARHGNSFAESIADLRGDKGALTNALMENCVDLPYQLASTTAAMPELLRACGVDESIIANQNVAERAQAVMDAMLSNGGGDLQKRLAGALNLALHNENTDYKIYQEYGLERTFYVAPLDMSKVEKAGDIQLKTDVKQRDGNWQVQIDVVYAGGRHEVVDLNLGCGGQVNLNVKTYTVRVAIDENPENDMVFLYTSVEPVYKETGQESNEEIPAAVETVTIIEGQPEGDQETPPDNTPSDETPGEEIQIKNPEAGIKVLEGEKEGELTKTANVEETGVGATTIEQVTPPENNAEIKQENEVADQSQTLEQQQEAAVAQDGADANAQMEDLSDQQNYDAAMEFYNQLSDQANQTNSDETNS